MFIDQLGQMYETLAGPPGIPWDGLSADGHGLDQGFYDPAYMDYMLKAGADFYRVLGTLSPDAVEKFRTLESDQAKQSMTRITALLNQAGADVWQATKSLDWNQTFGLPRTVALDALMTIAASASNGAYLHYDGVMEGAMASGQLKAAEVVGHAQSITQIFQTFVDLDKNGHLEEFKTPAPVPTSGLGIAPALPAIAGWALVALGVVLMLGICYLVYVFWIAAPAQKKALEWCDKIAKTGTPDQLQACVNSVADMQKNGNANLGNFLTSAVTPIVTVAAIGGALYFGSLLLPSVIANLRKAHAS